MASTKEFDLVAKIGEYEQGGEKKARWLNCGVVFKNEKGQLSAKITCIPAGNEWNGWLNLSVPSEQRSASASASASSGGSKASSSASSKAETNTAPTETKDADELPF